MDTPVDATGPPARGGAGRAGKDADRLHSRRHRRGATVGMAAPNGTGMGGANAMGAGDVDGRDADRVNVNEASLLGCFSRQQPVHWVQFIHPKTKNQRCDWTNRGIYEKKKNLKITLHGHRDHGGRLRIGRTIMYASTIPSSHRGGQVCGMAVAMATSRASFPNEPLTGARNSERAGDACLKSGHRAPVAAATPSKGGRAPPPKEEGQITNSGAQRRVFRWSQPLRRIRLHQCQRNCVRHERH